METNKSISSENLITESIEYKCLICGENLGCNNPRQLCCKTYCPFENIFSPNKKV